MDIRATSDAGTPIVANQPNSPHAKIYQEIAQKILDQLAKGKRCPKAGNGITIKSGSQGAEQDFCAEAGDNEKPDGFGLPLCSANGYLPMRFLQKAGKRTPSFGAASIKVASIRLQ